MSNLSIWKDDGQSEQSLKDCGNIDHKKRIKRFNEGYFNVFKARSNSKNKNIGHYALDGFGGKNGQFAERAHAILQRSMKSGPVIDRTEELREFYENKEREKASK